MIVRKPQKLVNQWEVYLPINRKQTFMASFKEKRHAELFDIMWDDVRRKSRYNAKLSAKNAKIAKSNGITRETVYQRLKRGWDLERSITEPTDRKFRNKEKPKEELKEIKNKDYDKVMNYLFKKFYFKMKKETLYQKFPDVDKETIDVAWKNAKEVLV